MGKQTRNQALAKILEENRDFVVDVWERTLISSELADKYNYVLPERSLREELKNSFLKPLFALLIDALCSGDKTLFAIYLDERLRYAPHRESSPRRLRFHAEVLEQEVSEFQNVLDYPNIQRAWLDLHESLWRESNFSEVNILAVGDCLFNEVRVFSPQEGKKHNISLNVSCMYFNASAVGGIETEDILEHIDKNSTDIIALSFFTFDAMPGFRRFFENCGGYSESQLDNLCMEYVARVRPVVQELSAKFDGTIVLHGVSGLPLRRNAKYIPFYPPFSQNQKNVLQFLNSYLKQLAEGEALCLFLDESEIAMSNGIRLCSKELGAQRKYGGMFHTSRFGAVLAARYAEIAAAYNTFSRAKLLLLDFDNTLWKGVIGDGEVEHFRSRQNLLIELQERGLVLAATSKNSPENIRWGEMTLQPEHFAIEKINWMPKAESINQIAKELNLGLSSFVFIDDNRHERSLVSEALPDVKCLDADDESVWKYLEWAKSFPCSKYTEESKRRTAMYRQQAKRSVVQSTSGGNGEALKKLGLWYEFGEASVSQMERVHELITRTNQFNTTTKRYSRKQLDEFTKRHDAKIYVSTLGDEYGSLGLVAVMIVIDAKDSSQIDSFIMSCRAMGFGLEKQLLFECREMIEQEKPIVGYFNATDRNGPCKDLYRSNGFEEVSEGEWVLSIDKRLNDIDWLTRK